MPDVNWKVREASEQFIEDALWWLEEFDLDGARIDAVKHVDDLAATNFEGLESMNDLKLSALIIISKARLLWAGLAII